MNPLSASIFVAAVGLIGCLANLRRIGQLIIAGSLLALWIAGTPICASWLTWQLEGMFPPASIDSLPQSDAVIVLGGIIGQPLPPRVSTDLGDPVERYQGAKGSHRRWW